MEHDTGRLLFPSGPSALRLCDFERLLSEPRYRGVAPLVEGWFGCRVVPEEGGFVLLDARGVRMDPSAVHKQIQVDAHMRSSLYQTAMSLWR